MKKKVTHLISEDEYWAVLDKSYINSRDTIYWLIKNYQTELSVKSMDTLVGIWYYNIEFSQRAFTYGLWAAVRLVTGDKHWLTFQKFRQWLITRRKHVYEKALADPDSLFTAFSKVQFHEQVVLSTALNHWVEKAIQHCLGEKKEPIMDFIKQNYILPLQIPNEEEQWVKFSWDKKSEINLREACPKIFSRYWSVPLMSRYWR